LASDLITDEIKNLPSYVCSSASKKGDYITETINMITSPGNIILKHESKKQINDDYEYIR